MLRVVRRAVVSADSFQEAGSDTTASTILSFILALLKYPGILKKAQQEVDAVCGDDRSPIPEDATRLPYLSACVSEVGRFY